MVELLSEYNPKNLNEAVDIIDKITKNFFDRESWLNSNENSALIAAHHSLGWDIRNAWGLWAQNSNIYKWFINNDIQHPDDMSSIILICFHRKMNDKEWDVKELIQEYKNYWK
jgi:hypothetical protein